MQDEMSYIFFQVVYMYSCVGLGIIINIKFLSFVLLVVEKVEEFYLNLYYEYLQGFD